MGKHANDKNNKEQYAPDVHYFHPDLSFRLLLEVRTLPKSL
jgi:hypothetical protein